MKSARLALAALALGALALAGPAGAQYASPRLGSFELGAGTYTPDIDSDFAAPGPYEQVFGKKRGWMFRAGVSRTLFSAFGSLDLGIRSGLLRKEGKGLTGSGDSHVPSGDSTTFDIVPTSATLTYRFDWLTERFNVPLAPYGRVAFERYNWWVSNARGAWKKRGATNGWSWSAGGLLLLDFFDPGLARELDADTGINHSYLFFDVTQATVDDFGSKKSWDLSNKDLSLSGGLLFVF